MEYFNKDNITPLGYLWNVSDARYHITIPGETWNIHVYFSHRYRDGVLRMEQHWGVYNKPRGSKVDKSGFFKQIMATIYDITATHLLMHGADSLYIQGASNKHDTFYAWFYSHAPKGYVTRVHLARRSENGYKQGCGCVTWKKEK